MSLVIVNINLVVDDILLRNYLIIVNINLVIVDMLMRN